MKKISPLLMCIVVLCFGCDSILMTTAYTPMDQAQVGPTEQTYQVFYDGLAPYGTWLTDPQFGYVWMPNVGPGFEPYSSNGHWVYTNSGWTWVSNYNWGWATFHYGRWFYQNGRGWIWIPGHEWGPAWVVWGNVEDYYAWAPMGPGSIIGDGWMPPSSYWNFVSKQYMYQHDLDRYIMDRNNRSIFSNRVNLNRNAQINPYENPNHYNNDRRYLDHNNGKSYINIGPRMEEVRQYTNSAIRPLRINENKVPVGTTNNRRDLFIYKPPIMHQDAQRESRNRPAPQNPVPSNNPLPIQVNPTKPNPIQVNPQPLPSTPLPNNGRAPRRNDNDERRREN